jgi:methylamine utilization protein MauJ
MPWVVVGVETSIGWPTVETRVPFRGREVILRPETDTLAPTVIAEFTPPGTYDETLLLVREFLSSLAWVEGHPIRETVATGGGFPIWVGKSPPVNVTNPRFQVDYLPDPLDPRARLALALYRDALGVSSEPFRFLGFYKIINVVHRTGPQQIAWINASVNSLEDYRAQERAAQLRSAGRDIGAYLYESGRCAVAHAFDDPIVNPENPQDTERLVLDMPLIKALAEEVIENVLGVQSQRTVYREHLYELDGFRTLIGPTSVGELQRGAEVDRERLPQLPRLSIRVRNYEPLATFEAMPAEILEARNGGLLIRCASGDGLVLTGLFLNFAEERLEFDPFEALVLRDDGSPNAAMHAFDAVTLRRRLVLNGQLEVWNADTGVVLGRCDPVVPVNVDIGATVANLDAQIERISAEAHRRAGG